MSDHEQILKGLALSPGISIAKVCLFDEGRHNNLPVYHISPEDVDNHIKRFETACLSVTEKLLKLKNDVSVKVGSNEAEIFSAQSLIVSDPSIKEKVHGIIRHSLFNTEKAVADSYDFFEQKLKDIENEYLNQRTTDLTEIKKHLLDVLSSQNPSLKCSGEEHCKQGKNRIIVARELTPSLTIELFPEQVKGFLTEHGGIASHAAILARSLEIPAVSGIPHINEHLFCGKTVIIDGNKGLAIINPKEETIRNYKDLPRLCSAYTTPVPPVRGLRVMANINSLKEALAAKEGLCEGIGLYRTEFEFILANKLLSEDEQYERYKSVTDIFPQEPVYFRAADLGGDKITPAFKQPEEKNPGLGFRGSRLLLKEKNIFTSQVRALARISKERPVHIMYPMIVDYQQFKEMITFTEEITKDIKKKNILHGLMFEVPAACLEADKILTLADFASIGTNDLTQYLLAVDRDNELVASDYLPNHPIIFQVIRNIAESAKKHKKPLSVCGEIAGNPKLLQTITDTGIESISINPKKISCIRERFKTLNYYEI